MKKAQDILAEMLEAVPDIKNAVLLDIDGIPLAIAGTMNLHPDELGALLAATCRSYLIIGEDMGQGDFNQIVVNYQDVKLFQFGMARSSLALIAAADVAMSVIRLEAKRAVAQLMELMDDTADEREQMIVEYRISKPEEED